MTRPWWVLVAAAALAGCGRTALTSGSPGTGGGHGMDGGAGGAACDQLESTYALARTAAHDCTPGAPHQCQALVPLNPRACPPDHLDEYEYVNDDTQVLAALAAWNAACLPNGWDCPNGVTDGVPYAERSTCVPAGTDATTGSCVTVMDAGVPDGGETCEQLAADYAWALSAALACTPGAANQCQQFADRDVPCIPNQCPTLVGVNDSTGPTAAEQRWSLQCGRGSGCLAIACNGVIEPRTACVPVDSGSPTGGLCMYAPPPRQP
jgi:hypothetical protein